MSFEGPTPTPQEALVDQPVIDFDHILDTYGLGPQEASATITFGNYTGTVAAMLLDERCPVGGVVAGAFAAEGIAGVDTKLGALKTLYGDFDLRVSDETRSYHEGVTERSDLLTKATQHEEPPGFLVE
jgi:hypothetical protein